MKTYVKFWFLLLAVSVFMTSCQKEVENELESADEESLIGKDYDYSNHKRACGLDEIMEGLMANPNYRAAHEEKLNKLKKELEKIELRESCPNPKVIPVAIHFQNVNNTNLACLTALAQQQVNILNADFGGTNSDIATWNNTASSYFPGVSNGEACLKFCIADKNHPSGFGLNNGDLAITLNQTSGDQNGQWSGYLNFYVRPNTGYLGYAPLGGDGNGDGVVIDAAAFGAGSGCGVVTPGAPYNLGRTLTHELGHYLLLDHIWGNGCNQDDDVADTPDQASDHSGCPSFNTSSCGSRDMHMNYMDYTNDACMYMFSAGQISRAEAYVNSSLANLTNNAQNKCSEATGGGDGGGDGGDGGGTTSDCDIPTSSSVNGITTTQANVTWTAAPDALKYQLRYRKQGTTSWTLKSTSATSNLITSLLAATTYQYQLRTQCPSGWTAFGATQSFTTLSGGGGGGGNNNTCMTPTTMSVTNISADKAKVIWNAVPNAISYRIKYRRQGTTTWTTKTANNAQKWLAGLQAGKTYQYRVKTQCPTGMTAYSPIQTFTTTNGGGGGNGCVDVTVKVVLDYYGSETSWEVVNQNYNIVANGGPYQDNQAGAVKTKNLCLPEGCYTLYIDDEYGDGICCDYGDGYLEILSGGQVIGESDGYFGYYDVIDFCVENGNAFVTNQSKDDKVARPAKTMME